MLRNTYYISPIIKSKRLNRKSSAIILLRKMTANNNRRHEFVAFIYRFKKRNGNKKKINTMCICV